MQPKPAKRIHLSSKYIQESASLFNHKEVKVDDSDSSDDELDFFNSSQRMKEI